jgi:chaperonin cofactor prefoldin
LQARNDMLVKEIEALTKQLQYMKEECVNLKNRVMFLEKQMSQKEFGNTSSALDSPFLDSFPVISELTTQKEILEERVKVYEVSEQQHEVDVESSYSSSSVS